MLTSDLSRSDPHNAVSPARKSAIHAIISENLTPRHEYRENFNNKTPRSPNDAELFCVRWTPPIDKFYDYIKIFRQIIGVELGGTRISKYKYTDATISTVMSVGSKDSRSALPQRITLSNFKLGNPITSYGCICRYINPGIEGIEGNDGEEAEYLLIKRNNSVSYIDIIRGSYRDSQLFFMIQDLPDDERKRLIEADFPTLWEDLHLNCGQGEAYDFAKDRFAQIKDKLKILFEYFPSRDPDGKYLWLFPKGKADYRPFSDYDGSGNTITNFKVEPELDPLRPIPESPFECALREFSEETNGIEIYEENLKLADPIIERYLGSNSKNYQTNYFVFELSEKPEVSQFPRFKTPLREVSIDEVDQIVWVRYSELDKYLCPARLELCHYIETSDASSHYPECCNPIWKCPAELAEFCPE